MFIIHPLLILSTLKHSVKIFGDFLKMTNVKVPMGKMLTTSNTRIIYAKWISDSQLLIVWNISVIL